MPTAAAPLRHARRPGGLRVGLLLALLALRAGWTLAQPAPDDAVQRVEIVGTTPVPGTGVPKDQIPSNVQTVGERRLRQLQSLNLPDAMAAQLPGVNVNEMQGNPYQIDVNYRGFAASPLLGTPQGLSVFQDGVRINEPFGDVVNWDLVPRAALASLTLLPGSNPLFGLNTLGGAVTLETKRGDTHPGTEASLEAGSFGRRAAELAHGRRLGEDGHLFVAASAFDEQGWRDFSPTRVRQLFAKAGRHAAAGGWDLSVTHAQNRLFGNGPLPESMLAQRRAQIYTRPDITDNRLTMLALNASAALSPAHRLAATLYLRRSRTATLNADLHDGYDPPAVPEAGIEHRAEASQQAEGLVLQSTLRGAGQQLSLGVSHDRATSRFAQTEALGSLDATRLVVPAGPAATSAQVGGRNRTNSVYAHDLIALAPTLQLTLSARYNDTRVTTVDEGRANLGLDTRLDGDGRYRRLNPAAGLTWQASAALTAYASVSQGNRAPSPIELGCADPANPCVLPNALQSDPPLRQVVSRTLEAGLRGSTPAGWRWNASAFRSVNDDDLLFVSNGRSTGYFTNFGRTRRQGIELGLAWRGAAAEGSLSYSRLAATYGSAACIVAEGNSTAGASAACAGAGDIEVRPGDRLPGLPRDTVKLGIELRPAADWSAGLQLRAFSGQFVRGNENNRHAPDGAAFSGSGRLGGFAVADLTATWRLGTQAELFGKLANLFDRRYASAGLLGLNAFDAAGALQPPADWRQAQFVGPGAPRSLSIGLRLAFGG